MNVNTTKLTLIFHHSFFPEGRPKQPKPSTSKRPRAIYDDDSDEDDLMDDIVGCVTSGNLPIEIVENKVRHTHFHLEEFFSLVNTPFAFQSFQRILKKAQRHKKKRSNYKITEVRDAIREGVETGTVKLNAIEAPALNIKTEVDDEDRHDVVNEIWLKNTEHSDYHEESDSNTNSSMEAPLRPSTSKKFKSSSATENLDIELVSMLLSSSSPFELIDNPAFKKFVNKLNPNYQLPRSKDLKEKIITSMANAKYF